MQNEHGDDENEAFYRADGKDEHAANSAADIGADDGDQIAEADHESDQRRVWHAQEGHDEIASRSQNKGFRHLPSQIPGKLFDYSSQKRKDRLCFIFGKDQKDRVHKLTFYAVSASEQEQTDKGAEQDVIDAGKDVRDPIEQGRDVFGKARGDVVVSLLPEGNERGHQRVLFGQFSAGRRKGLGDLFDALDALRKNEQSKQRQRAADKKHGANEREDFFELFFFDFLAFILFLLPFPYCILLKYIN